MGENFLEHVAEDNRRMEGKELPLMAAMRDGKSVEARVTLRHKDGHPVQVRLRAVPLRNDSGRILGAAEYFEPIEPLAWLDNRKNVLESHGCMDHATGALTRAYTETQLQEHLETFERHTIPFGVIAMQVDGLDQLKVKHGAGAVTSVMKLVGHTLLSGLRTPDQLGRWTDSEYLVIAAECTGADTVRVGERLRKIVSGAEAEWWGDKLRVTLSNGIAAVKEGDSTAGLVDRAERALQRAIVEGGDRQAIAYD
jgi:diguanylate cyclase (GGDEF)-like protein